MGSRVVPKFWKHNQYQNFEVIDIEMEEDIDIDKNIDIEKCIRFWYLYWAKYCKILSLYLTSFPYIWQKRIFELLHCR